MVVTVVKIEWNRGRGSISKVERHWPKGALSTKIKRFYVVHEPNEKF